MSETVRSRSQLQMEQMFLRVQRKLFSEATPTTLAHYSIVRTIGQGAMGVVYEAIDTRLGREVALKLVLPERLHAERGTPRLIREARAMAKISHPNVVAVYDVGESNGAVFIAMEYVRGVTLRQWLANAPRSLLEILDVFVQAGSGLAAAHRADIVHRDFKPDNVLIGADGRARVLDFGLAHARAKQLEAIQPAARRNTPQTMTGAESTGSDENMLVGTIAYMAPEQLQSRSLDGRSDQFGFCVSLYEALFGQRPFHGRSFDEFVDHVFRGELAPVESPPRLPSWLRAAVRRGLSIAVEPRFGTMTELVNVLAAGRHLLAAQRAQPALAAEVREHLLDRQGSVLDEPVLTTATSALVRIQRLDDHSRRLATVALDPRASQARAAFAAYFERIAPEVPDAPARLRPLELINHEACQALVWPDVECVTIGGLLHQGGPRDLGLALEVAAGLARAVHHLAQVGYAIDPAALDHLPVAVDDYAIGPVDPTWLREAPAAPEGRYGIVGAALLALLSPELPELETSGRVRSGPPAGDTHQIPPAVRALIERLLEPAGGYRSARGVLHDLARCLAEHRRGGPIPAFPLGARDLGAQFAVSSAMRGRERELERFEVMARQVGAGGSGLALVSGPSGIGKSLLIDEMNARLERGLHIQGKFDQYARGEPYATLAQALRRLIRQILDEPAAERQAWRDRIVRAVAPNAALLFSVIPEIRALIGDQRPAAAMPPVESAARFGQTLKRLLAACAAHVELLVVALDDMQWCDPASIQLICALLGDREVDRILWICAFRDNEIGPGHPLHELLAVVPARAALRVELSVGPLSHTDLQDFLADTLGCPPPRAAQLATFFHDKTDGNPLFVRTLLTSLHEQGLFTLSPLRESWVWSDDAIRKAELPDDILELIARKIEALSPPARRLLGVASCVGRDLEVPLLLDAMAGGEHPRATLAAAIRECVDRGLLAATLVRDPEAGETRELLNFTHDRVQQTAHRFIDAAQRQRALLAAGRALLERTPPAQLAEQLFRIVGYLNGGAAQADAALRERIVELDLEAARRALAANAFADSTRFLDAALALLPDDRWTSRYEQTFELHVISMHAQGLLGDRNEEERLFELLREHVQTPDHVGRIYELKVMLESSRGEHRAAITRGVAGLRSLDEKLRAKPSKLAAFVELVRTYLAMRRVDPDAIKALPPSGRDDAAASRLLVALSAPAYLADANLLAIVMMRIVRRALQFGVSDVSSHGFAGFGLVVAGLLGRYERARRYAVAAHQLDERFANPWLQPKVDLMSGIFIQPWTRSFEHCEDILARGARVAAANADFVYASYASTSMVCLMYYRGAELDGVIREAALALDHARRARDHDMAAVVATVIQASRCLRGETASGSDFSTPEQSDRDFLATLDEQTTPIGVFFCRAIRCGVLYLHGHADLACELGASAGAFEEHAFSNPSLAEYLFAYAMSLLRRWPALTRPERRRARRLVRRALERFDAWTAAAPENFAARRALLRAEHARVRGRGPVLELLNQALEAAVQHQRVQYEALAAELAANHCEASGQGAIARIYLERALGAYRRWGAARKARELAGRLAAATA